MENNGEYIMNYKIIHDQIIERVKDRIVEGYTEKHHIIPICMDGLDNKDNLVELTAREHFIVHKLLCEIYPENHKLRYALWMMCIAKNEFQERNYLVSSREYERLKKYLTESGAFISNGMLGKNHSDESKEKISKSRIKSGVAKGKNNPFYGKKHDADTIQKIVDSNVGRVGSENQKKIISNILSGTNWYHKKDGSQLRTTKDDPQIKNEGWILGRYNGKVISKKANDAKKDMPKHKTNNKRCSIEGNVFDSAKSASEYYNINESTMRDRLVGRFRSEKYKKKYKNWYYID